MDLEKQNAIDAVVDAVVAVTNVAGRPVIEAIIARSSQHTRKSAPSENTNARGKQAFVAYYEARGRVTAWHYLAVNHTEEFADSFLRQQPCARRQPSRLHQHFFKTTTG
jgi:hypothetical protein